MYCELMNIYSQIFVQSVAINIVYFYQVYRPFIFIRDFWIELRRIWVLQPFFWFNLVWCSLDVILKFIEFCFSKCENGHSLGASYVTLWVIFRHLFPCGRFLSLGSQFGPILTIDRCVRLLTAVIGLPLGKIFIYSGLTNFLFASKNP